MQPLTIMTVLFQTCLSAVSIIWRIVTDTRGDRANQKLCKQNCRERTFFGKIHSISLKGSSRFDLRIFDGTSI